LSPFGLLLSQAIRDEDPTRPVLVGTAGHNDSEFLDPYVTEAYLPYKFDGGKGFYDDANVGAAIHFYSPKQADGLNFAMWTTPLGKDESKWKKPVTEQIMHAVRWRNRIGHHIPVVTTEWGCWMFDARTRSGDLAQWIDHHTDLFAAHDIGNMWYTGIQHNQGVLSLSSPRTRPQPKAHPSPDNHLSSPPALAAAAACSKVRTLRL